MNRKYDCEYDKGFDAFTKGSAVLTIGGLLLGGITNKIAKSSQIKAQEIYDEAQNRYMDSYNKFVFSTSKAKKTITDVVCIKRDIMRNYMTDFLKAYKRLAPQIKLQDSVGLGELKRFVVNQGDFKTIRRTSLAYQSFNPYKLGRNASDVALLMVQEGKVTDLANNMRNIIHAGKIKDNEFRKNSIDNLKIQSIGVIAEFSTVAIEYGISGISSAFNSKKQINEAKEAAARFEVQKEKTDLDIIKIKAIDKYANIHMELLNSFLPFIREYIPLSVGIIRRKDNIFHIGRIQEQKFSQKELEILAFTMSLVGAVKAVIDLPIIDKNGAVADEDNSEFDRLKSCVPVFQEKRIEIKSLK